jgi:hypothetical protein
MNTREAGRMASHKKANRKTTKHATITRQTTEKIGKQQITL